MRQAQSLNFAAMKLLTLLFIAAAIFQSPSLHARTKYVGRHAAPKNIDTLFYFEPLSSIKFLDDKPQPRVTDSLSKVSRSLQRKLLENNAEVMRNATLITVTNPQLQKRIDNEFVYLIGNAIKGKLYEDVDTTSVIDSFMDATNRRFVLLLFNDGYVKSGRKIWDDKYDHNYRAAKAWGYSDYMPGPVGITIYGMIFDAGENKTYYFNKDTEYESGYQPLELSHLQILLKTVFEGFFWPKHSQERW